MPRPTTKGQLLKAGEEINTPKKSLKD